MLDSVTKKRIDDLRNILVGKIPSPQSQVEQITTGLIYKFMHDMDNEAIEMGGVPSFFVDEYEKYSWKHLFNTKLGGVEKVKLYSEAIENLYNNPSAPDIFREIFKNSFLPFKDPTTLNMFLKEINEFHYSNSEQLGDAYEYLLSFMGSQGDAGQFRTPRHIIDFIIQIVNPQKHETILDPACGTSGFLISSYKHILTQNTQTRMGDQLNAAERKEIGANLVGYDIDPAMSRISLVNMYLHNFASPNISEYDTLSSEDKWNEYFDVILANPPFFSPSGGIKPHSRFGIKSNRAEVLFVDYIIEHLKPTGRAGIIVPEGIIFQMGNAHKALRKKLIENSLIGVISLPSGVFQPYSGVKTSILILDKELNKKFNNIFFAKLENDGFSLGAQRNIISDNDIPKVKAQIKKFINGEETKLISASKEKISRNNFNLTIGEYQEVEVINSNFNLVTLNDVLTSNPIYGSGAKKAEFNNTVRYIRITDIDEDGRLKKENPVSPNNIEKNYFLNVNDILIARSGSVGRSYIHLEAKIPCQFAGYLIKFPLDINKIYPLFFFFITKSKQYWEWISRKKKDGTISNINAKEYCQFPFPLPKISIQQEIVKELDSYQKIIDGCKQVIENYKPSINIDPSWEKIELKDLCKIVRGSSPRPKSDSRYYGGSVPRLMVADLTRDGIFVTPQIDSLTELGATKSRAMKKGEVVIAVSGNPGLPCILNIDCCIHDGFVGCQELSPKIKPEYLCYLLLTLKTVTSSQSVGAVFKNLTTDQLKALPIPIPSLKEQTLIIENLKIVHQLVDGNYKLMDIYNQRIQEKLNHIWGI